MKEESDFYISYHGLAEAVFSQIPFYRLLQREMNHMLVSRKESFRIKVDPNNDFRSGSPRLIQLNLFLEETEDCPLEKLFPANHEAVAKHISKTHQQYQLLREEDLKILADQGYLNFVEGKFEQKLSDLCDSYVWRICNCIGKDTLLTGEGLEDENVNITASLGFHFTAKIPGEPQTHFKYYSVSGWKLHDLIVENLKDIKSKYHPDLSNLEFVLTMLLVTSVVFFNKLLLTGIPAEEHVTFALMNAVPDPLEFIKSDMGTIIGKYLPELERDRWKSAHLALQPIKDKDFEHILRSLLLLNEWKQKTDIGIFAEQLVSVGDEIITDNYAIEYKDPPPVTHLEWWNYSVATRVEDFFIGNTWLEAFERQQAFLAYLVACPIFFRGKLLGDFFVTGTYDEGNRAVVIDRLLPLIEEVLPFLRDQIEYLAKVIMSYKLYDYVADRAHWSERHVNIDEAGFREDEILNKTVNALQPVRDKIAEHVRAHAISAAVSQVLNLNMAHSGSHYLDYWEKELRKAPADALSSQNLLEEQAEMVKYIKFRTSFLAIAATQPPFISSPVKLSELELPNLIQRFIAKSEKDCEVRIVNANDDVIAIPHGKVGMHAFYSIVENMARNCAKHQDVKIVSGKRVLDITIILEPYSDDLWKLRIRSDANLKKGQEIRDLQNQIDFEASHIFDPVTYELKHKLLGLKEMLICAAFLRGIPYDKLHDYQTAQIDENEPPLLSLQGEKGASDFSHVLYVLKPKEILFITKTDMGLTEDQKRNLSDLGFDIRNLKWLKRYVGTKNVRHRFVVFAEGCSSEEILSKQNRLPRRIIQLDNSETAELTSILSKADDKGLVTWLYPRWIEKEFSIPKEGYPELLVINDARFSDYSNANPKVTLIEDELKPKDLSTRISDSSTFVFYHAPDEPGELLQIKYANLTNLELYTGISLGFETLQSILTEGDDPTETVGYHELVEAALAKVLIIDERLWEQYGATEDWLKLHRKGITVVGPFDDKQSGANIWNDIVRWDGDTCSIDSVIVVSGQDLNLNDYSTLLLHYGMLEKDDLVASTMDGESKAERIRKIVGAFEKVIGSLVLHSGRGHREYMPEDVKFMEYEVLSSLIDPSIFKHELVQQVMRL